MVVPLLMQNKVPDGFETDDKLDVSLRPDEVRLFPYDLPLAKSIILTQPTPSVWEAHTSRTIPVSIKLKWCSLQA